MNEWLLISLMALITFSIRYILIATAGHWHLPPTIEKGLRYVPIAILSAIVAETIMVNTGNCQSPSWSVNNQFLVSAVVAFTVAKMTNSLMITVTASLIFYGVLHYFTG